MRIMMMTNTYLPHVGGVARSVAAFSDAYRELGHEVLVVAPEFEGRDTEEQNVVRVPAVQNFNGSDFSLVLPSTGLLSEATAQYQPDIIHAHHPFLIGSTALRLAAQYSRPLVFTHHTMYEQYTHYAPGDSPILKRFVAMLSIHFANACQRVFAPSESVAATLQERGVIIPIDVIPTGVRDELFKVGHGAGFRAALGIDKEAFVLGHVGRLAPEKNLDFLAEAIALCLQRHAGAVAVIVGSGPCTPALRAIFRARGVHDRAFLLGALDHPLLASAYRAMDVFAFASKTETQGMVLTEAMAASVPVIALDAPGAREVVVDGINGRLLTDEDVQTFAAALSWCANLDVRDRQRLRRQAKATAARFSLRRCASHALSSYAALLAELRPPSSTETALWDEALNRIGAEWTLLKSLAGAAGHALTSEVPRTPHAPP